MKKMKKVKVIVSYVLLLGLSLQSFSPLLAARNGSQVQKKSIMPERMPERTVERSVVPSKTESTESIMPHIEEQCRMQTDMDGNNTIVINSPDLTLFVAQIVRDAITDGSKDSWSEEMMLFCEKVLNGKKDFTPEELSQALPELMALLSAKMEGVRAPRLDAPGTDGAIVGPLLDCNFDEVLRLLNKIFQFIKQCCENIEVNFQATFTILADIKATLTECCEFLGGTFTVLFDIKSTLTECCEFLGGTFTVLADIKATLTECCEFLGGTFTVLEDIRVTLTTCCENFTSVFTVLNDIKITLTDCCANFDGTFTVLNDIKVTLTTCCENFNGTFTAINDIKITLTECCENFNGTFTVLEDIRVSLTACCQNFDGTFTVLEDIRVTLTTCCENFTSVFTAINAITTPTITVVCDFSAIFTVLIDIKNTLTECCENLNGTFTVLGGQCTVFPLTQDLIDVGGGFTITVPGNYVLKENISSPFSPTITIAVSEVTLDLCGRTLSGDDGPGTCILVNADLFSVTIKNGHITDFNDQGIFVSEGVVNLTIEDVQITNCGLQGIQFLGTTLNPIRESIIRNCQISECGTDIGGVAGLALNSCDTIYVQGGNFNRNGTAGITTAVAGILLNECANCNISGASMNENTAQMAFGVEIVTGINNIVSKCVANQNVGVVTLDITSTAIGFFALGGSDNNFDGCTALMNTGSVAYGFSLGAGETLSSVIGCIAESNVGDLPATEFNGIFGAGIAIDGINGASFNEVQNNLVVRNNQSGIFDSFITFTTDVAGNSFVVTGSSTTLVSNNSAVDNGLSGPLFDTTTPFRNYTVAYPTGLPVQFVSFRYSTGLPPVVSSAGDTILSNIDTRFGA